MTYQIEALAAQIPQVREALYSVLLWSNHDFIRTPITFFDADRALYVDQLTRALPERDDLRFVYRDQQHRLAIFAERLPWDSDFFGYPVARLNGIFSLGQFDPNANYEPALSVLLRKTREKGITYLFANIFPEDLPTVRALTTCGFSLIETRTSFHRTVDNYAYPERFSVRLATPADIPSLSRAAQDTVNPYDRFHADPFLSRADVDHLMVQWVEASIQEQFADATFVPDVPNPGAFTTVRYHQDKWKLWGKKLSQLMLCAVAPEFRGWHLKITSEIAYHLREKEVEHVFLVTQLTNRAVVHNLEKLGFRLGRGEYIFRRVLSQA